MFRFYERWLSMSLRRPFGVADGIGVALGTLAQIMVRSFPAWDFAVTELLWQIPLGIFALIGLVRLGRAPYWMYQERDEKARQMEIGLEVGITELHFQGRVQTTAPSDLCHAYQIQDAGRRSLSTLRS